MNPSGAHGGASRQTRLEQLSIPRLFFGLLHQRFTGTVKLEQPDPDPGPRTIWMRGGMPVFTNWVAAGETLGQVLLRAGVVTPEQLTEALATATDDQTLGEALVKRGAAERKTIAWALREQCARKLVQAFKLRSGTVTLAAIEHALGKDDELGQIHVLDLIHRGVSLHYDERRVVQEMGTAATTQVRATSAFERYRSQFNFRADDEVILSALSRGTHFQALLGLPGMHRDRAAQVAFVLWACQMLTSDAEPARAPEAARPSPGSSSRPARPDPPPEAPLAWAFSPASGGPPPSAAAAPPLPRDKKPATRDASPAGQQPAPAPAPGSEAAAYQAKLASVEAKIEQGAHAFDLLGVKLDATKQDVRRAWGELSRVFHPDALQAKKLGHLRARVERVFAALSEAQLDLADAEKRKHLREIIESGGDPHKPPADATAIARAALESEVLAREGDKLIHAGKYDRALAAFEQATALNPAESEFQASIAWCRYQLSGKKHDDARAAVTALEQILEESPNLAIAHYYRGLILLRAGSEHLALSAFNAAHAANPKLTDAERQARAIMMRRNKPKKKGGLFGR